MRESRSKTLRLMALAATAAMLGACGGFHTPPQEASFGFATRNAALSTGQVSASDGINRLVIARVFLAVVEAKIDGGDVESASDLEDSPVAVELDLSGAVKPAARTLLARGAYKQAKLKLGHMEAEKAVAAPGAEQALADLLANGGSSVVVQGSYNGAPFRFRSAAEVEGQVELDGEMVVKLGRTANLTFAVDPAAWFRVDPANDRSPLLDPADPQNESAIARNLSGAFRGFEDDDLDGVEDGSRPSGN